MNVLEFLIVLLEFSEQLLGTTALDNKRAFVGLAHNIFPELIDGHEFGSLLRQLFLNVLGCEDVLEVHPLLLTAQPLINNLRDQEQLLLPYLNTRSDFSDIP